MTYGIGNILGVALARPVVLVPRWASWPKWAQSAYTYAVGAHFAHALDFAAALLFFTVVWPRALPLAARGFDAAWVGEVVAFNLATMIVLVGFWHWAMYGGEAGDVVAGRLAAAKFNKANQYGPTATADDGHLRREVTLQTLGWLQAAALQCVFLRLYATRAIGDLAYEPFWAGGAPFSAASLAHPQTQWNLASVALVTFWREIHFYFCHRAIHPWSAAGVRTAGRGGPWWDLGGALYRHAHAWHHKSVNPGPWSGLSMHPVEHFFYFSCAWLPLLAIASPSLAVHPMHFLYAVFHACIAPIAGHDGHAAPGGNSSHHYLHHAFFEINCESTCLAGTPGSSPLVRALTPRPPQMASRGPSTWTLSSAARSRWRGAKRRAHPRGRSRCGAQRPSGAC